MYNPVDEEGTILDRCSYEAPTEVSHSMDTEVPETSPDRETRPKAQSPVGASRGSEPMGGGGAEHHERSCAYPASGGGRKINCVGGANTERWDEPGFEAGVSRAG